MQYTFECVVKSSYVAQNVLIDFNMKNVTDGKYFFSYLKFEHGKESWV